ncbi:hypothetical protein TH53_19760 [Pedobacter lusitanus]|uniref:Uncharacterized protein n=2 Tax=Pedobacter lusitanus TaxID=1503925 RepID=A0A0D0GE03_9SPHI|nr:hypothetical protein TH53_19760 [Pedobacter lusitanus]
MASPETVMAALRAALINDNPSLRIYPFPVQVTFTDNSTDAAFQTFGSGSLAPVNDGMYDWTFQFTKGGLCLSNKLRKFNGNSNQKFLVVDGQGMLYGTKVGTSLKGIPANYIFTDKLKAATYETATIYAYRVNFMPTYFNENIAFLKLNLVDLLGLNGLQDIVISNAAPRVTNVIKVKLTTGCAGIDMYDLYSTELAAVGNFVVTEAGKNITITSVAADPNSKSFTITLDATDPDYSVAGPFIVSTAPVSVLTAAGVVGYEGKPLTVA